MSLLKFYIFILSLRILFNLIFKRIIETKSFIVSLLGHFMFSCFVYYVFKYYGTELINFLKNIYYIYLAIVN